MASVFVKDGRLVLQMRIRGVQLREALHLRDTAANRKWAQGECAIIERELITGTFDYWQHFLQSRSAKAKGIFPKRDRPENLTVEAWLRRWFLQAKPRWGSAMAYDVETMVNRHIVPEFGARLLGDLTFEDIGHLTGVLRGRPGTRGHSMGPERINERALRASVDAGILSRSPMTGWQALRTPKPEMRPFTREDFCKFLDAVPQDWQPYFEFAVWTGLRPGEQAALHWLDVDLKSMLSVLNVSNLTRRVYYPALQRADLISRPLYNLRHTFAVFMLEAGENPGWVARQMGHTSGEMLWRRYARWWPQVAQSDGLRAEMWWNSGRLAGV